MHCELVSPSHEIPLKFKMQVSSCVFDSHLHIIEISGMKRKEKRELAFIL